MKKLTCKGYIKNSYPVYCSTDEKFTDFLDLLPNAQKKIAVIDSEIINLFPAFIEELKNSFYIFPVISTEENKTFDGLEKLCEEIFKLKISKDDILVAIGGGLVLNLGGLAGSLVMRGIKFYYVPTTLTGQIDACLGSKQAVNFMGAKNWIGMYNDPEFVYINPHFLKTVSQEEINSQLIEGLKLCLATNKKLFNQASKNLQNFSTLTFTELNKFIEIMIKAKLSIVKRDLLEHNYGMSMLYGHTVGHAIEMLDSKKISHGEGVGLGMLVAARISVLLGLADSSLTSIHEKLLKDLNLSTKIPSNIVLTDIVNLLDYNKKNFNGKVHFILLRDVGSMAHVKDNYYTVVPDEILITALEQCN